MKSRIRKIVNTLLAVAMLLSIGAIGVSPALAATTAEIEIVTPAGTSTSPYNVNLTAGEYDDWAHFGHTTATSVNRKAGVTDRLIGSLSLVGTGSLQEASTDDVANHRMQFSWTDGTAPNASLTTKYFIKNGAEGIKLNFTLPAGAYEIKMFSNCYNERADVVVTNASGTEIARRALITGSIETWAHMARETTITYESDTAQTITVGIVRTEFDAGLWPGLSVAAAAVKKIDKEPENPITAKIEDIATPGSASFDLGAPEYGEWTHYGEPASGTSPFATKKASATTNIVGQIRRGDGGGLTREQNTGVPAFSWTGGTPTASATATKFYAWAGSGNNLSQVLDFPAGNYRVKLYLIGLRVTANLSVTGSVSGEVFRLDNAWTLPSGWSEARECKILTIDYDSAVAETVTVLLTCLANNSGSTAVQAVTVQNMNAPGAFSVSASASPSPGGSVTGAGVYATGETVNMAAVSNAGYVFKEWQIMSGSITIADKTASNISFVMPEGNVELRALFSRPEGELQDLTQYINMRLGTSGASNTLIGTQRPNASVSPGPDTNPQNSCTGYNPNGQIRGFSQIHVSGTGVGKYGQFLVSPQVGLATRLDGHDSAKADENPTCSEYSVTLSRYGINASFTPAEHSTIYKFVYPASGNSSVLIDVAANIANANATQVRVNTGINEKGEPFISGSGNYSGGWGSAHNLYFYAVLQKTGATLGLYNASGTISGTSMGPVNVSDRSAGMGAYATFPTTAGETVYLKIATSFKSIDQAKIWLDQEIPAWDYNGVREETERQWNEELNKIVVDGDISNTNLQIFYTAIYHAHIMPRDRTGDLEKFGTADMIDDHLCVWDTWRTLYPLYAITNPDLVAKTVNSFVTRNNINKYVRDSFVAGVDMAEQQGGDNIDCIVSDAYVKGIEGIDDWEEAYKVVKNNADNYRLSWLGWGTQNLNPNVNTDYKTLGYIPSGGTRQMNNCSYTLEYAYNDYCAALIAKGLGKTADYEKYLARSNNWTNIWNPNLTNNGYSGYIVPRTDNFGPFVDINPTTSWGSWVDYFYEASAWNYSFFVPHDVKQLIEKMGGQEMFANRLKTGVDRGWVDFGNEPAFLAAALYNHTDRPWMTSDSMAVVRGRFSLNGVPGNDDSGAMSSWYIFSATGLFPNSGQNIYYITSPIYETTTYNLDNGKQFRIIANNLSATNKYIQSVTINGKPYYKTWFGHEVIVAGSTVVYEMGPNPVNYAKAPANSVVIKEVVTTQSISLNLSDPKYSEWAHFTGAGIINRKGGVAEPVIGGITGGTTGSSPGLSISWTDGTPTQTGEAVGSYTSYTGNIRLPLKIPAGSTDVTVYYLSELISFSVFNEAGEEVANRVGPQQYTPVAIVTLSFDCEQAEEYTLVINDTTAAMTGAKIAAATVEAFESFNVTFDSNGADEVPNQIVRAGGKVTEPEALTRTGYVFGGWVRQNPLMERYWIFDEDTVIGNMTLRAVWVPLYTATFVPNGGSAAAAQTLPQGSLLAAAPTARTGYAFDGWFRNAAFTGVAWDFATDTLQANVTLYAKWNKLPEAEIILAEYLTQAAVIDLSAYGDWAAFGLGNAADNWIVRKDTDSTIIGGIGGYGLTSENLEATLNSFTWSGGTPVASAQGSKYAVVGNEPVTLSFNVPAGGYSAQVYYTSVQGAPVSIELFDENGTLIDFKTLPLAGAGSNDGIAKLAFYCEQERVFTLRLTHGPTVTLPVYKYGIKAVAVTLEAPGVTVTSGDNGTASGGGIYEPGSTVTVTATPNSGYRFKEWQVVRGSAGIANTPTASFTMPAGSVTLKAIFEEQTVWVRSNDTVANLSRITLSQPQNADWAYLGYSSGRIMMASAANRIFSSNVSAVSGGLNQEDMAQWNSGTSPYFNWTGGTPTATGTDVRYILWNNIGLRLNVAIPKGLYEVGLYISGVRAGADLEVLDAENNVVLTHHLWNNNGETRVYRKLNINFDCKQAQTYTIRLLVVDQGAANYSVSIFAGVAEKLGDYYTISATAGPGGSATGGGDYISGREATLTATADDGYLFDGWYESGIKVPGEAVLKFNVSGDRSLEARFIVEPTNASLKQQDGEVAARFHINNSSGGPQAYRCMIAVYDPSGKLRELKTLEPSATAGPSNFELKVEIALYQGCLVKAFIWSNDYVPLCNAAEALIT